MARERALRAVDEEHMQNLREVEEFADSLPDEYLLCRELSHNWRPHSVGRYKDGGYQRTLRCNRCRTKKVEELTSRGMRLKNPRYIHPEGYLHEGFGGIFGEGRGILRIASITRSAKIKELD